MLDQGEVQSLKGQPPQARPDRPDRPDKGKPDKPDKNRPAQPSGAKRDGPAKG
jgi:hypothetical protein